MSCTGTASRDRLDPEHLVQLLGGEPMVTRSDGTEHLGHKLDLVKRLQALQRWGALP